MYEAGGKGVHNIMIILRNTSFQAQGAGRFLDLELSQSCPSPILLSHSESAMVDVVQRGAGAVRFYQSG